MKKVVSMILVLLIIMATGMFGGCSNTQNNEKMKADKILKNAKIYTSDSDNPQATALVIKDGKFDYVGDEEGLKDYEGEVVDMGGKFITPTFMDAHVHLPQSLCLLSFDYFQFISGNNKADCLKSIKDEIDKNPDASDYTFNMSLACLGGEQLTKEDLDAICSDKEVLVLEAAGHSSWSNSLILKNMGVTDDTPDMAKGDAYFVRDEDGHITGEAYEGPHFEIINRHQDRIKEENIEEEFTKWVDFCKEAGVSAVYEAGTPGSNELTERAYEVLSKMDKEGKLPVYIEGSYTIYDPAKRSTVTDELNRLNKKFNTEHFKVDTLKVYFDGSLNAKTAKMVEPYVDTGTSGGTIFDVDETASLLKELNANGYNFHAHCVGEGGVNIVLDAVENVKKELGDNFKIKVTIAHNMTIRDEDIPRFEKLGVIADFTAWWFSGAGIAGDIEGLKTFMGDRAYKMYRAKSVWDTGAMVTWSSDNTEFGDFSHWNPMLGIEVAMTRQITKDTKLNFDGVEPGEQFPDKAECMSAEEMILGYTVNAANQLCINDRKGTIEPGKDADYIVFDEDLLNEKPSKFSQISPKEVWFEGKQVNSK